MNVPDLVDRACTQYRDRVAVEFGERALRFGEVQDHANRLARYLTTSLSGGDHRIAVLLPNCLEFVEIDFGIAKAGFASVQISPKLSAREIGAVLADAQVSAVVFHYSVAPTIESLRDELPSHHLLICVAGSAEGATDYTDVLDLAGTGTSLPARWGDDRLYRIAYTSGTTGLPKGVRLSTRSIVAVTRNLLLEFRPDRTKDRLLHLAPLCHGTGMFVLPWFLIGGTSVIHDGFDAERTVDSIGREGIGTIKAVPTMMLRMLQLGDHKFAKLRDVGQVIYGGSPMPIEPMMHAVEVAGPVFTQLYGQSEAPMTITVLPREDHVALESSQGNRLASAGRPWTCVDVAVVDESGRALPPGEKGEIAVTGDHVMDGYWRNEKATAETLVDGWVRTGDIGVMDEHGYVFLLDRKHDMIITGGLNVYPREVEDVLYRFGTVAEAAVVGLPDPDWGERVVAVVSARSGQALDTAKVITFCRSELAGYKTPKQVIVVDELPKNAVGKISRKIAKAQLVDGSEVRGSR